MTTTKTDDTDSSPPVSPPAAGESDPAARSSLPDPGGGRRRGPALASAGLVLNSVGDVVKAVVGHALGTVLVNPVLEYADVDGVVRRIEVDDLAQRIDVNAVLDKVDVNKLLDRVDFNRHLGRVDFDAVLERVDINDIIQRSDAGAILAQSTASVLTPVLDVVRTKIVVVDLVLIRMSHFRRMRGQRDVLPPRPGVQAPSDEPEYSPERIENKAIVVQGRYTGFFAKAVAIFIDVVLSTVSFLLVTIVIKLCWILFLDLETEQAQEKVSRKNIEIAILWCICWFLYFYLTVLPTGRTPGMMVVGIALRCSTTGSDFTASQAAVRTLLLPLSLTVMPLLGLIGFLRQDGRMLHDVAAGTGLVYSWDAVMAKARQRAAVRVEQMEYHLSEEKDGGTASQSERSRHDEHCRETSSNKKNS
jgi:uncharacterized RDD family membrane protein YckC